VSDGHPDGKLLATAGASVHIFKKSKSPASQGQDNYNRIGTGAHATGMSKFSELHCPENVGPKIHPGQNELLNFLGPVSFCCSS
jgi:hypothetical protein